MSTDLRGDGRVPLLQRLAILAPVTGAVGFGRRRSAVLDVVATARTQLLQQGAADCVRDPRQLRGVRPDDGGRPFPRAGAGGRHQRLRVLDHPQAVRLGPARAGRVPARRAGADVHRRQLADDDRPAALFLLGAGVLPDRWGAVRRAAMGFPRRGHRDRHRFPGEVRGAAVAAGRADLHGDRPAEPAVAAVAVAVGDDRRIANIYDSRDRLERPARLGVGASRRDADRHE